MTEPRRKPKVITIDTRRHHRPTPKKVVATPPSNDDDKIEVLRTTTPLSVARRLTPTPAKPKEHLDNLEADIKAAAEILEELRRQGTHHDPPPSFIEFLADKAAESRANSHSQPSLGRIIEEPVGPTEQTPLMHAERHRSVSDQLAAGGDFNWSVSSPKPLPVDAPTRKKRNVFFRVVNWYRNLFLDKEAEAMAEAILVDMEDDVDPDTLPPGKRRTSAVANMLGMHARHKFKPKRRDEANELAIGRWLLGQVFDRKDIRVQDREHVLFLAEERAFTANLREIAKFKAQNSRTRSDREEVTHLSHETHQSGLLTRMERKWRRTYLAGVGTATGPAPGV